MDIPNQQNPASKNTTMAILAYIGPLVIISFLTAKDDPFVKFHIKQGLVLFVIEVVLFIASSALWAFWMLYTVINLGILILSIIGIMNAAKGVEQKLPLVGNWAQHFSF
jgi:uncharacterized membrane protein